MWPNDNVIDYIQCLLFIKISHRRRPKEKYWKCFEAGRKTHTHPTPLSRHSEAELSNSFQNSPEPQIGHSTPPPKFPALLYGCG